MKEIDNLQLSYYIHDDVYKMFGVLEKFIEINNFNAEQATILIRYYEYIQHDNNGSYYYKHCITGKYLLIDHQTYDIVVGDIDFEDYEPQLIH